MLSNPFGFGKGEVTCDLGSPSRPVSTNLHHLARQGSPRRIKADEDSSNRIKPTEGASGCMKPRKGISECIKICEALLGFPTMCGAICAQKASSDSGLGNGKLRFLGSGKVPERIVAFCGLAEFTFSCKLLNHLFSTLAVRCRRDSASSKDLASSAYRIFVVY